MQFGVCGGLDRVDVAKTAGYDYVEWSVGGLLQPREPESAFLATLTEVRATGIPFPVLNCFVPGDLKITGPDADMAALTAYVETVMHRAQQAGIDTIVFGSGGARRIPDGFCATTAHEQLARFCRMVGEKAAPAGVTIAVEPLATKECNVLTSVGEVADLVREVNHPAIRLLADTFHMMRDNDPLQSVIENGDLLRHVHVASVPNRLPPGLDDCDFAPFFNALEKAGYDGRVSIEAKVEEPAEQLPPSLAYMRGLAG